jgi:hypothetical protein
MILQPLEAYTGEGALYSLIQTLGIQVAMKRELAPFVVAFVIAELFYKFRSFALECIAFLITWAILSYIQSLVVNRRS